jgi:hypothetical protein
MSAPLDRLLAALDRLREPEPENLVSSLRGLPEVAILPSPWDTWTLIGLTRHRERQWWVADIIRTRLQGDVNRLATFGALGHPDGVPQRGTVPGLPEWEYFFHGRGCCLTHKIDGDAIDVDFWNESADYFDTFFYIHYLNSLRRPEPPEQRLRDLHPSTRAIEIAVNDMLAAGALTQLPGRDSHPYRVADQVLAAADIFDSFCAAWINPNRRVWFAALVGDWLAADEAASGRPELAAITSPRAWQCRQIRLQRLRRELDQPQAAEALEALADLGAPDLDQCLENALCGPPSGLISAALRILEKMDNPRWCSRIYDLFCRMAPAGDPPRPHMWITTLRFLLRHGYRKAELVSSLAKAGGIEVGEAVLLSLEYAPEFALPLIRKALLADIPINRTKVAAILALIGAPWSQRELLEALDASGDPHKTADVRAALLESGDEESQRSVLAWEKRYPHESEAGSYLEIDGRRLGPFCTFAELALKDRASRMRYEMDQLHDRVEKLKAIVPPEPRQWWKLWKT